MSKKKPTEDELPHCEDCKCGEFNVGEDLGECHLLPMQWVPMGENNATPMWSPAVRKGYCRHFDRKVH